MGGCPPSGLLEAQQFLRDDVNQTPERYSKNIRDIPQEPHCNKTYSTHMPKPPCVLPRIMVFSRVCMQVCHVKGVATKFVLPQHGWKFLKLEGNSK